MTTVYDTIGVGYSKYRQPDPRIARLLDRALGDAATVLNVGAGTGSYEPVDRLVTALEPSVEMIRQRPSGYAVACQGVAECLPFADCQFDAVMAVLTIHHWSDVDAGLREMLRVAKEQLVILTFDPEAPYFWLADYLPEIIALDQPVMPRLDVYERVLGDITIKAVPVPHNCTDGFLGAYWRRPHAYLNPDVRSAISTFSKLGDIQPALATLEEDLASGQWDKKYGHLLDRQSLDIGYRLIIGTVI